VEQEHFETLLRLQPQLRSHRFGTMKLAKGIVLKPSKLAAIVMKYESFRPARNQSTPETQSTESSLPSCSGEDWQLESPAIPDEQKVHSAFYQQPLRSPSDGKVRLNLVNLGDQEVLQITAHDLTQSNSIETAPHDCEAAFHALAETHEHAIFIYQNERLCYVNPAIEVMSGYTKAELLAMNIWDLVDKKMLPKLDRLEQQQQKTIFLHHELGLVTKNGQEKYLEIIVTAIDFAGQSAILGIALDVTPYHLA
jgi:PAS domain S-box-containing protein